VTNAEVDVGAGGTQVIKKRIQREVT